VKCCCLLGFADLLEAYLRCRFAHFQVGLQAFHEEAVCHIAPVNSLSHDRSWVVVVQGDGALACACARARGIERAEGALARPHEAVKHTCCVDVNSFDLSVRSVAYAECALTCPCACARGIERRDRAVGGAQKAVTHTAGVNVESRDLTRLIDGVGASSVASLFFFSARGSAKIFGRPWTLIRGSS